MAKTPAFSIRVGGVQVSLWENETDKGVMRSITMNKSYKDKKGQWQTTTSFKPQDLALLKIGMDKVMEHIYIKDAAGNVGVVKEEF